MKSEEKMVRFCSYAGKIVSGRQWGLHGLIVVLFWAYPLLVFSAVGTETDQDGTV